VREDSRKLIDWERGGVPLTTQLANLIRSRIDDGTYLVGQPLPTQANLVSSFGVSATVVKRACDVLDSEGVIKVVQGHAPLVLRRSTEPRGRGNEESRMFVLSAVDEALEALVRATDKLRSVRARYVMSDVYEDGSLTRREGE
jgi:DNA-binding GntR family transcriptional regulator